MKIRSVLAAAVITAGAFGISLSSANADVFSFTWSFTDGGTNFGGGTFTATQDLAYDPSGAVYQVFSISGTALGQHITGLTDYGVLTIELSGSLARQNISTRQIPIITLHTTEWALPSKTG